MIPAAVSARTRHTPPEPWTTTSTPKRLFRPLERLKLQVATVGLQRSSCYDSFAVAFCRIAYTTCSEALTEQHSVASYTGKLNLHRAMLIAV